MAFYQSDHVNRYRAAGLIQDEPRGLFTDLLILKDSSKITACRRKIENKDKRMKRKQKSIPRPSLSHQAGSCTIVNKSRWDTYVMKKVKKVLLSFNKKKTRHRSLSPANEYNVKNQKH